MISYHPAVLAALHGREPTDEQWEAISYGRGPLSIVAGAGSGKTAVMAARIAYIVSGGWVRPSQILGLTFTNKAAAELEARIRKALLEVELPPGEEVAVYTYHAFADRLLRDYGPKIGVEPEVALLSDAQAFQLVGGLLEEISFSNLKVNWLPTVIGWVRTLADACANHLIEPERVIEADAALLAAYEAEGKEVQKGVDDVLIGRPDVARAVRAYIERKKELHRIDYGDQVSFACRILTEHADVAAALKERWPVVLLDEYQDTNVAQRKMLEAVYGPGDALTVVGDPDQAIYGWRGATLHNILKFPEHFPAKNREPALMLPLERSFRCGARILTAANTLIGRIPLQRRGMDKVLRPHPDRGEGVVTADLVASDTDEAVMIADEIRAFGGSEGEGLDGVRVPWNEIAVLCRGRRLFRKLQHELKERGVPVEVVGLSGLLETAEVNDLVGHLKVVAQPGNNVAFARVAMGPRWRIGFRDMAALARWAALNTNIFRERLSEREGDDVDPGQQRFYLYEALGRLDEIDELSDEARSRLARLHDDVELLRADVRGLSLLEAIEKVLDASGIEAELSANDTDVSHAARANLAAFLDAAAAFSPLEGEVSMGAFLDYLDTARTVEAMEVAQPRSDDSVKLMTVHQAKGLEFDVVYIPGLVDKIFPSKRTANPYKSVGQLPFEVREDHDYLPSFVKSKNLSRFHKELQDLEEEEERRLVYVAITRARRAVHLSAAWWYSGSMGYERKYPSKLGAFFTELAGRPADEKNEAQEPIDAVTRRRFEPCPEESPLLDELAERSLSWPPSDDVQVDEVFPDGWREVLERVQSTPEALERELSEAGLDPEIYESERTTVAEQLTMVTADPVEEMDERLTSLSVSSLVQLANCPKQFYWTTVRPLPRRPSSAARLGQEIHRWIEIRSIGQQRLGDPEEFPDLGPEETQEIRGEKRSASLADLQKTWSNSRFAAARPRFTEQAFVVALPGGYLVRGRIDSVYVDEDGNWEIVDFKSGRMPEPGDPAAKLQLAIYALAAQRVWGIDPGRIRVTYFYLRDGSEVTYEATELDVDENGLVASFEEVEAGRFEPQPNRLCHSCDFLKFCEAGRKHVEAAKVEEAAATS